MFRNRSPLGYKADLWLVDVQCVPYNAPESLSYSSFQL